MGTYPLAELAKQLGLDDVAQACAWTDACGLPVDDDGESVVLKKVAIREAPRDFVAGRAASAWLTAKLDAAEDILGTAREP